jgi:hypothetical protein
MSQAVRGPVMIDTGVFGARLALRTRPLATLYELLVEGRAALISFVTVAHDTIFANVGDLNLVTKLGL